MKNLLEAEMKRVQQFAVDVTLDPDTAHPKLILSDDGKQVEDGDLWQNLPDNPERFSQCVNVLGRQSFSSGRFYFEVQVKGKTDWDLGVARGSITRKGNIPLSPQDGFWTVVLRNGNDYKACAGPSVRLHLHPGPEKVGVFVDYEEGLVSFYDVEAAALIYSFTSYCFTEKIYPFFSPCNNNGVVHLLSERRGINAIATWLTGKDIHLRPVVASKGSWTIDGPDRDTVYCRRGPCVWELNENLANGVRTASEKKIIRPHAELYPAD
ncbi:hypothetical protein XENOCAPTIV_022794 [Xenoophorus captivus]|uniref:B30.2/SPRY domain-containing protein n=1 Tax=Xenoophorus captivus TaxID=1517983 RepID=A0ABV0R320_9TELE